MAKKYDPERGVRWFCYGCSIFALLLMGGIIGVLGFACYVMWGML